MENKLNMKTPYLEIYLNQEDDLCIARAKDKDIPFQLIVNVTLDELRASDPTDAAYRVGGTVLNLLQSWHEQLFGDWKVPAAKGVQHDDSLYIGALKLIELALSTKTAIHNVSIATLLQEAAKESEDARKYLDEAWPMLRDRLTRLGNY
ncbi:hypothetical protein [Ralstonia pseudosolanacearum]|nr:hypothetical protein [Ralstonia pseudosolanacearum]